MILTNPCVRPIHPSLNPNAPVISVDVKASIDHRIPDLSRALLPETHDNQSQRQPPLVSFDLITAALN